MLHNTSKPVPVSTFIADDDWLPFLKSCLSIRDATVELCNRCGTAVVEVAPPIPSDEGVIGEGDPGWFDPVMFELPEIDPPGDGFDWTEALRLWLSGWINVYGAVFVRVGRWAVDADTGDEMGPARWIETAFMTTKEPAA